MPYVFEMLDSAASQELIQKVRAPIYAFQPWQVIDRGRDILLADLGGDGSRANSISDVPSYYNLIWQGFPVAFSCRDTKIYGENSVQVDIKIETLEVPKQLLSALEEIKKTIGEAMQVFWEGRKKRAVTVRMQFPAVCAY